MQSIAQKLKTLPQKPGVYLFKNAVGEVLYVGKAKNLKNRVKSYFQNQPDRPARTAILISEIADLDYVIVSSETESLILENNLIKQYLPRFNVRLRDDKNYQFIKIDYTTQIPQVYAARRVEKGRAKYFGPYTSSTAVKQTLKLLRRLFQLCGNKKVTAKPCFYYHLKRCPGVCIGKVNLENYRTGMAQVEQFLNHRQSEVTQTLKKEMLRAARQRQFEKAAVLRDRLRGLENIWQRQKIIFPRPLSQDYFSLAIHGDQGIVNLFMVREGKLIHQENFQIVQTDTAEPAMILESFLKQYYARASNLPKEVVTKYQLPDRIALRQWLRVRFLVPQKGRKRQLLDLGEENAEDYYEKNLGSAEDALRELQERLHLPELPRRMEGYDISNIQGFLPVGSMVVFEDGVPKKTDYRKFKIQRTQTPNDFAMMAEMLHRRLAHLGEKSWPRPTLLVIDGGKGQLNAVTKVLATYRLQIPAIGLAKRLEEIFLPGSKIGIRLRPNSRGLFLLQRLRDEAHRFAIGFYRRRHRESQTRSRLDDVWGLGPKTRQKLLKQFGTVSGIQKASAEALAKIIGMRKAKLLKTKLAKG